MSGKVTNLDDARKAAHEEATKRFFDQITAVLCGLKRRDYETAAEMLAKAKATDEQLKRSWPAR